MRRGFVLYLLTNFVWVYHCNGDMRLMLPKALSDSAMVLGGTKEGKCRSFNNVFNLADMSTPSLVVGEPGSRCHELETVHLQLRRIVHDFCALLRATTPSGVFDKVKHGFFEPSTYQHVYPDRNECRLLFASDADCRCQNWSLHVMWE